jgi:hypothetical protein
VRRLLLRLLGLSKEEATLFTAITAARGVQDYLWGDHNKRWDLEEWRRMFAKRLAKVEAIDPSNPHAMTELKKRILQNTALGVAMLSKLDDNMVDFGGKPPSNLPEYAKVRELEAHVRGLSRNDEQCGVCDKINGKPYWQQVDILAKEVKELGVEEERKRVDLGNYLADEIKRCLEELPGCAEGTPGYFMLLGEKTMAERVLIKYT